MAEEHPDSERLFEELHELRIGGIDKIRGGVGSIAFPVLCRIAETGYATLWRSGEDGKILALRKLLLRGIATVDQDALPLLGSKDGNRWAEWAEILFDIRQFDNVTQRLIGEQSPSQRYAKLAAFADQELGLHFEKRTFGRRFSTLRRVLAERLLEIETQAVVPDAACGLVDRPEIDNALRAEILRGEAPIVWVHGDPGVGKTTALRCVLPGDDVVWIDCFRDPRTGACDTMYGQMATILDSNDINTSGHNAVLRARFLTFLAGNKAPSFAVFENFEPDPAIFPELQELVIPSQCGIVIVSRFPPPSDHNNIVTVPIADLTREESRELVGRYVQEQERLIDKLADRLFGRALLLDGACRLMQATNVSIAEYLEQIASSADLIRSASVEPDVTTLSAVAHYRLVLARVCEDSQSFNLLSMVAELGSGVPLRAVTLLWSEEYPDDFTRRRMLSPQLPQDVIDTGLSFGARSFAMVPHSEVSATVQREVLLSVDKLAQLGMVEVREGMVHMHLLTRMVLRELLGEESLRSSRRIVAALASRARQWQWRGVEAVPPELLELVHSAVPAIVLSCNIADSKIFDPHLHDEIELAVALYAASARQVLILRRAAHVMEVALLFDKRQLVRVENWGHIVLGNPSENRTGISGDRALSELTSVLAELNLHYGSWRAPNKFSFSQDYRRGLDAVGVHIPSVSWLCCKKLNLEFTTESVTTGSELAAARESLLRQRSLADIYSTDRMKPMSERMLAAELHRQTDQQNLLIYGRYLASIGNCDAALDILLFNARAVTKIAASVESIWIAMSSLLVAADLLLRLGRIREGSVIFHELLAIRESRSGSPSNDIGRQRFRLNDRNLDARILILQRELDLRSCFDEELSRSAYEAARAAYADSVDDDFDSFSDWRTKVIQAGIQIAIDAANEFSTSSDLDLRYALTEQAVRFSGLSIVLSENLGIEPIGIGQRFADDLADWQKLKDEQHVRVLGFGQLVFYTFCEAMQPGSVKDMFLELVRTGAGSEDVTVVEKILKDGVWDNWTSFAESVDAGASSLALESAHWYELARVRVLAACGAAMSGTECESIRRLGAATARDLGRNDWESLIETVRDDPAMLALLFVR